MRRNLEKQPRTFRKKKMKKEQLHNVISLRISDDEKRMFEKLVRTSSKSISDIMREAVDLWVIKRRQLCLET